MMAENAKELEQMRQETAALKRYKVAVVIPSGDRVHANFATSLAMFCHLQRPHVLAFVNPKGSNIPKQRWTGVRAARGAKCDWVLMLDSDMSFPYNVLTRLLAHDKDIVGCAYAKRVPPHSNLMVRFPPSVIQTAPGTLAAFDPNGLLEVAALPTGVLLIRTSVFDKFTEPYFRFTAIEEGETLGGIYRGPDIAGEDYGFCLRARELGFKVWCDLALSREIIHWGETGTILSDPTAEIGELVEIE